MIIKDFTVDNDIDILALTETWLHDGDQDAVEIGTLCPTGYRFLHQPRFLETGGGVGLLFKENFRINNIVCDTFQTFELMDIRIRSEMFLRVLVIYRPPAPTYALFYEEFSRLLEKVLTEHPGNILFIGDFNFHVDNPNNSYANRFINILESFDLKQYVRGKTHKDGHTLDLVIARSDDALIQQVTIQDPGISDHHAIHCKLSLSKPKFTKKTVEFRKLRCIGNSRLSEDILNSELYSQSPLDLNSLVTQYNNVLRSLLDNHAPLKKKNVTIRPSAPWYTLEVTKEKKKRRCLERKWRKTGLTIDREQYLYQCSIVNNLIASCKTAYYTSVINEYSGDQKVLFKTINKLLQKNTVQRYPSAPSNVELANDFADFFSEKIAKIQRGLSEKQVSLSPLSFAEDLCNVEFSDFRAVTQEEVRELATKPLSKSCQLDPLPANIMKGCFDTLLPVITDIVNMSLSTGLMPDSLKTAELHPLLKKQNADYSEHSNFRPISNLPMVSKVVEKAVAVQLTKHVTVNNLGESLQSAYKKNHSTETALIKVQNDILRAIDNRDSVILLMLDLSAAFDTVDHSTLLKRLSTSYGLSGVVLDWFRSYLASRKQYVMVEGCKSLLRDLDRGVPQGSVLGPLLYLLYTSPIAKIIKRHGLQYHLYADDSQLYTSFKTDSFDDLHQAKSKVELCVRDIDNWMVHNGLKLNQDKSELLLFTSRFRPDPVLKSLTVVGEEIKPTPSARNLGTVFDTHVTLSKHLNTLCKVSNFHLRNICKIRKYLSEETTETLVHAFVSSRLDNCNSLLYGLPDYQIHKLQLIQNAAARIVTFTKKSEHITPVLQRLHWLPVHFRIIYKICIIIYKALNGLAPLYIAELFMYKKYYRSLRASTQNFLVVPKTNTVSYGDRAISVAGPKIWNDLPNSLRQEKFFNLFKLNLKTYLFRQAFL